MKERRLTDRELQILSAWWLLHSVRSTARFFTLSEQTIKNQLYNARIRNGVHTSADLAALFMGQLRTMDDLLASHNGEHAEAGRVA